MTTEEQQATLIKVLRGMVRVIAALAGAVVGVGSLAFSAGFLAQRAQYDFVQVPFVFVDYWAYAETGLMALVKSLNLFVGNPFCLAALGGASIALILALESEAFRKHVFRAHWVFLSYLLLICWLGLVLRQQLAIRELRDGPVAEKVTWLDGSSSVSQSTVPGRFPFRLSVPKPRKAPSFEEIKFPETALEGWRQIARDLERESGEGAQYLEVRPRPNWALVSKPHAPDSEEHEAPILGIEVGEKHLDANRAEELYRSLLSGLLVGLWFFGVLVLWQRRVYQAISTHTPCSGGDEASKLQNLLTRLQEELWFSSKWVLQGIAGLLLVATGVFLMPECYGLLAQPRLGREYVEVISDSKPQEEKVDDSQEPPQSWLNVERSILEALAILSGLPSSGTEVDMEGQWRAKIESLERDGSSKAAEVLKTMADASSAVSGELSDLAREAWRRVASLTLAATEGYILYYPRSETDYLRILERNPDSPSTQWTISPIKMSDIVEIRVKRNEQTLALIEILESMADRDPQDRQEALVQTAKLGHERLLEVALAGTRDPSHIIRGFSITDVGRYSKGLLGRQAGHRIDEATRRLVEILRSTEQRQDHRAAAATSLHQYAAAGDEKVCGALTGLVREAAQDPDQPFWNVLGSAITTIGILRCRSAVPFFLDLVDEEKVPIHIRGTIPSSLTKIGTQEDSSAKLGELLKAHETPADVVGPAITALSLLVGSDSSASVAALEAFLSAESYSQEMTDAGLVSNYRVTAIDSLRQLGDPSCVDTLHKFVDRSQEEDEAVRQRAVKALGEFEDSRSEEILIKIAEDEDEEGSVRIEAVDALENFHSNSVVRRLAELHEKEPSLQGIIFETLKQRGVNGSSAARFEARGLANDSLSRWAQELPSRQGSEASPTPGGNPEEAAAGGSPEFPASLSLLTVGNEMSGSLDESDERLPDGSLGEAVPFSVRQGQKVTVDLISDDFDGLLYVAGPGMEEPLVDDDSGGQCNSRIEFTAAETGSYYALVNTATRGVSTGAFRLRISENPPPPAPGTCSLAGGL